MVTRPHVVSMVKVVLSEMADRTLWSCGACWIL